MNFYFTDKAERQLGELPQRTQDRIRDKMRFYASQENPFSFAKKVTDQEDYRLRVGDYRARFITQNGTIIVVKIEPRDKAYD